MTNLFAWGFAAGLAAIAWIGLGFIGTSWPGLLMTAAIAAVYLAGAWELRQFRAATGQLRALLERTAQAPSSLPAWLQELPPVLRGAVGLRVEGGRAALPGPALTPYLAGLLVMLGMLGTFIGMVVTFRGAVFALEGSTDLQAIRSALAAPIGGLGLAFGTSVAGVAASAMLGLMAAISRRERLAVGRLLDARIAGVLRPFSLAHQRQETLHALQGQGQLLPQLAERMDAMMQRIEQRSAQLDAQLLARQGELQREVGRACAELAHGVAAALKDSIAAAPQAATRAMQPAVQGTLARLADDARTLHAELGAVARQQVEALSQQFAAALKEQERTSAATLSALEAALAGSRAEQARGEQARLQAWTGALQAMGQELHEQLQRTGSQAAQLLQASEELARARGEAEAQWAARQDERMDQALALWRTELASLRQEEALRGQAAVARLEQLQGAVAQHLALLGASLEAPLTRLLQTAAEVPQAAASVIARLREEMAGIAQREHLALAERTELLQRLRDLLAAVDEACTAQRTASEGLVASASAVLEQAGQRFAGTLQAQAGQATEAAAQLAAGALEVASLAEAFGHGMELFQSGNEKLVQGLERMEASLRRSTERSDEQLAYYVAQAREVIDLSIASQQGLVENLRQLQARPAAAALLAEEARA